MANKKTDVKSKQVYEYVRTHPGCFRTDIISGLNFPKGTIERYVRMLKDDGKLKFIGTSRSGGYYVVEKSGVVSL